jgi:hypothetical protein
LNALTARILFHKQPAFLDINPDICGSPYIGKTSHDGHNIKKGIIIIIIFLTIFVRAFIHATKLAPTLEFPNKKFFDPFEI